MCLTLLASCGSNSVNEPSADIGAPSEPGASPANTPPSATPSYAAPSAPAPTAEGVKFADTIDMIIDNSRIATLSIYNLGSNNSPTNWVFKMIYDRLLDSYEPGVYEPMLATSWETEDWQTVTMSLRDDVYFHNGDKFTADDVVYTVLASRDAVGTPVFDRWSDVDTVTALDAHTVQFVLKRINVDWFYNLAQPPAGIVNQRAINEDSESGTEIGTGAFTVKEFATNDYVVLERNDNYWGDPPITQNVILRFVPEASARLMMLQNGQVDVCFSIDVVDRPLIDADTENFVVYPYVQNNANGIGFNMDDPICGDWNFRMAVVSAIDREEVTLAAWGDYGIPETTGTLYGLRNEFRNDSIPIVSYDLDKAREYLAASPYNGETIELSCGLLSTIIAAEVIQQQLTRIGIRTNVVQMDPPAMGAYLRYGDNKAQMFCYVFPFQSTSAAAYRNLVYPGASLNRTSYNNPEIAEMLDKAPTVYDNNERGDLYMRMQEIFAEDPSMFNLFWLGMAASCVKGVGGMHLPYDLFFDLRYVYKIIE